MHGVASLETKHTVLVKAKPMSSNVTVTALLLLRIDSHVVPGDEVHGMASLEAKHTALVEAKSMSSLEMKYMMIRPTHPSSSYLQLRAFKVRGFDMVLEMELMESHPHVVAGATVCSLQGLR